MGVAAVAIGLGLLAGLVRGGRPSSVLTPTLRLLPALVVGFVLQWVPDLLAVEGLPAFVAVAGSSLCLVGFALANLRLPGMPLVLLGLVLNTAVIVANGGMPVRPAAVVDAGIVEPEEAATIDVGPKRHLEHDDDVLVLLGDVIPVSPLREVVSIGDLVLAAGLGTVVFRLLRPRTDAARSTTRAVTGATGRSATDGSTRPAP